MGKPKRIRATRCCAALIDMQGFFLAQVEPRQRARLKTNAGHLVRLIGAYGIPLVVTLERPLNDKGGLPKEVARHLPRRTAIFEKEYFDLCKENAIKSHLARLGRRQVIVAGCETDVCVLQSCLGLIALGHEVFAVEELLFSSARKVDAALTRMHDAGVVFVSYKTLYYELLQSVAGPPLPRGRRDAFERALDALPDAAD